MQRCGDHWVCSACGHQLEVDQSLAMETALSLEAEGGPCSAKNMTFAQTAVYIRKLELRWMEDQRRIHNLERQMQALAHLAIQEKSPSSIGAGAFHA